MTATTNNTAVLESRYAWLRLLAAVMLMTIGGAGMYTVVVVLPALQNEFQIARAAASFPFTATMLGFAAGGLMMGKLVDRYGVMVPVLLGALMQVVGFSLAAQASSPLQARPPRSWPPLRSRPWPTAA